MLERCYPAQRERLEEMLDNFRQDISELVEDRRTKNKLVLCAEEVLANIVDYAYDGTEGNLSIGIAFDSEKRRLQLQFTDEGMPYDPLAEERNKVDSDLDDTPFGGLGIYLYTKIMDEVTYQRLEGKNQLTMWKEI